MENTGANQGKELNTTFKLNYKRTFIIGFAFFGILLLWQVYDSWCPTFLTELFKACKNENISTCLDTSGYGNDNNYEFLNYTDLVILDIKHYLSKEYLDLTKGDILKVQNFLEAVKEKNYTKFRKYRTSRRILSNRCYCNYWRRRSCCEIRSIF